MSEGMYAGPVPEELITDAWNHAQASNDAWDRMKVLELGRASIQIDTKQSEIGLRLTQDEDEKKRIAARLDTLHTDRLAANQSIGEARLEFNLHSSMAGVVMRLPEDTNPFVLPPKSDNAAETVTRQSDTAITDDFMEKLADIDPIFKEARNAILRAKDFYANALTLGPEYTIFSTDEFEQQAVRLHAVYRNMEDNGLRPKFVLYPTGLNLEQWTAAIKSAQNRKGKYLGGIDIDSDQLRRHDPSRYPESVTYSKWQLALVNGGDVIIAAEQEQVRKLAAKLTVCTDIKEKPGRIFRDEAQQRVNELSPTITEFLAFVVDGILTDSLPNNTGTSRTLLRESDKPICGLRDAVGYSQETGWLSIINSVSPQREWKKSPGFRPTVTVDRLV
jgi:hypothetical protein